MNVFDFVFGNALKNPFTPKWIKEVEDYCLKNNCNHKDLIEAYENWEGFPSLCDVEGCKKEVSNGGMGWRESGYWSLCYKHGSEAREGKPQPLMKKEAVEKESKRLPDGTMPNEHF